MLHGVAAIGLPVPPQESNGGANCHGEVSVERIEDEPKRRLSQGRSMSRMDEMFMTIMRLRRKIPEKVIGHMFCISQPSVSRIVRAWTMLLSKILTLQTEEKPESSSTTHKSSGGQDKLKMTALPQDNVPLGIPSSFRQLFHSELARNIISAGNVALNSRKTSSSTTCTNTSRSKRPKKEKAVVVLSDQFLTAAVTAPTEDPTVNPCQYSIPSEVAAIEERSGCNGDGKVGTTIAATAASAGEI